MSESAERSSLRALLDETLTGGLPEAWDDDAPLVDAGLDSVAVLGLVARIEERLGLTLADEDLDARYFATVSQLLALLARRSVRG